MPPMGPEKFRSFTGLKHAEQNFCRLQYLKPNRPIDIETQKTPIATHKNP